MKSHGTNVPLARNPGPLPLPTLLLPPHAPTDGLVGRKGWLTTLATLVARPEAAVAALPFSVSGRLCLRGLREADEGARQT